LSLQALGAVLTLRSAAIIDIWELAGIVPAQPAVFRASGPYAWVRHPIYSGWFLFVWAVPTMTMTRFVFAAASCAYLLAAIPLEERTLRAASDGAYDRYMRQVRWKLVPGIY
jgi:protein-S-isoprenylcysteine O-methyltransferase Ste14